MTRRMRPVPGSVLLAFATAALLSLTASAQTNATPERFTATALDTNNSSTGTVDITVDRWSTDAERDALRSIMLEKGPERLLDALQDSRLAGHVGEPGRLSWDVRFARRSPLPEGGERLVLVTDRRIGFPDQPRSVDYPFTVIEFRLDKNGEGEGKMSFATKVIFDQEQNTLTLENYDQQPVQLTRLKRERASH